MSNVPQENQKKLRKRRKGGAQGRPKRRHVLILETKGTLGQALKILCGYVVVGGVVCWLCWKVTWILGLPLSVVLSGLMAYEFQYALTAQSKVVIEDGVVMVLSESAFSGRRETRLLAVSGLRALRFGVEHHEQLSADHSGDVVSFDRTTTSTRTLDAVFEDGSSRRILTGDTVGQIAEFIQSIYDVDLIDDGSTTWT